MKKENIRNLTIRFDSNNQGIVNMDFTLWLPSRKVFLADLFMNLWSFSSDESLQYKSYDDRQIFHSDLKEKPYYKTLYLEMPCYIGSYKFSGETNSESSTLELLNLNIYCVSRNAITKHILNIRRSILFKVDEHNDIGVIVDIKDRSLTFTQVSYSRARELCKIYDETYNSLKNNCNLDYLLFFTEA